MTPTVKRLLFWLPRLLCVAFIVFLSLSALDIFEEGVSFGRTTLALAIHLLPAELLLVILIVSWKWEWVGGVLFWGLSIAYFFWTVGRMHWSAWALISGTLFGLGFLFLVDWIYHERLRAKA